MNSLFKKEQNDIFVYSFILKMANQINIWLEGYIKALSEEKYSDFMIKKRCLNHGFNISKSGIHKVLKGKVNIDRL